MKKPTDKADVFLTVAAVWLAVRGEKSGEIGERARRAAELIEKTRETIVNGATGQMRQALGCTFKADCGCLFCAAKQGEPPCS